MADDRDTPDAATQKRGRLEVRGGQPLAFIEDANPAEPAGGGFHRFPTHLPAPQ